MTASNPTPDDLRIIAKNMKAEGQTSRAEVIMSAARRIERLELYLSQFHSFVEDISQEIEENVNRMREYFDVERKE